MGCGASSPSEEKVAAPAPKSSAPAKRDVEPGGDVAGAGATGAMTVVAAGIAVQSMKMGGGLATNRGLADLDVDKVVANLSDAGDKVASVLASLAEADVEQMVEGAGELIGNVLEASKEVLEVVLHVAIPPPGGAVIIACLTAAVAFIKSNLNVKELKELVCYAFKILKALVEKQRTFASTGNSTQDAFREFQATADKILAYLEEIQGQKKIWNMLTWGTTKIKIEDLTQELERVTKVLDISMSADQLEILVDIRNKALLAEQKLEELCPDGDLDTLISNPAKLKAFRDTLSADSKVIVAMLDANAADLNELKERGPHQLLDQQHLRKLWRQCFPNNESIKWNTFWTAFPDKLAIDVDAIKVELQKELSTPADQLRFQLAVEDMDDESSVSVVELKKAFPATADILEQVRKFKKRPNAKVFNGVPNVVPKYFCGREEFVEQVILKFSTGTRVVQLQGAPGEGKRTTACAVAIKMHNEGTALGGLFYISLAKVASEEALVQKLAESLGTSAKAPDSTAGVGGLLDSRLAEINKRGERAVLVLDDCEELDIPNEKEDDDKTLIDEFDRKLLHMLNRAPNLSVLICTRFRLDLKETTKIVEENNPTFMPLPALHCGGRLLLEVAGSIISEADAGKIADKYGNHPQLLEMVGRLLKQEEIDVEEALDMSPDSAASDNEELSKKLRMIKKSSLNAIQKLAAGKPAQLMTLSFMLGSFDLTMVQDVLQLKATQSKQLIRLLLGRSLLQQVPGDDAYTVTPVIRDAIRSSADDAKVAQSLGFTPDLLTTFHKRFIPACKAAVLRLFELYNKAPAAAYPSILRSKVNVQQALRLGQDDPALAQECLPDLLAILRLLPYMASAFDRPMVHHACDKLRAACKAAGNPCGEGLCLAVKALFMQGGKEKASADTAADARELLKALRGDEKLIAEAMACRAEGVAWRDMWDQDKSSAALRAGLEAVGALDEVKPEDRVEEVILMAELAGTLDYMGNFTEGEPLGAKAAAKAREVYGKESCHPVVALCLTNWGFFIKAKGENATDPEEKRKWHEKAIEQHTRAKEMRAQVLGKTHMDTSLSLQQIAISKQALGDYDEAMQLYKDSLEIRVNSLGEHNPLVGNTLEQMAGAYQAQGNLADAELALRRCLEIRVVIAKKKVPSTAKKLSEVLRAMGKEEDADQVDAAYSS